MHWVVDQTGSTAHDDVIAATLAWNERKRQLFSNDQIVLALKTLESKGWIAQAGA